ncbi:P-loop containing nucleoside triphosphate hydrolase protein [Coprinopsis marcescibilis]|uniref:P-loop containing nucleoside triphosphate hydrolase protein n=1 Tax=Coprinopsis marcescibilis TaxID=230819 RepID=A0A5C3KSS6_COPMA|nr:P-loop containing nucleoside triphosphate hydrolase protein [Coprinopsis marcescibilis]
MSQRKQPCRYFRTNRGCDKGGSCHFSHTQGSNGTSNSQRPSQSSNRGRSDKPPALPQPPHGVCRLFWSTGNCERAFDCRFKHIQKDHTATRVAQQTGTTTMPFLELGGYSKVATAGSDAFQSLPSRTMDPNEAHNALKRFLGDTYRFKTSFDVYAFLVPLNSANSTSNVWSGEDGQLFLKTIATGNGMLRIIDIILWQKVSAQAGSSSTELSFQKGYVPLLRFLASDFVVKSTLRMLTNGVYSQLLESFEHFAPRLEESLDMILAAGSFRDPNTSHNNDLSGCEIFYSLSTVLFECLTRFKNAVSMYPRLPEIVRKLEHWTTNWADAISKPVPTFQDALNAKAEAREVLLRLLSDKVDRLLSIVDREQTKYDIIKTKLDRMGKSVRQPSTEGLLSALETLYEGPGELRPEGARHDNDFCSINDIRIAPTHAELTCAVPPYLPVNLYNAPHHLPLSGMERLQDVQFRLLREELTAPLRTSVQHVMDDLPKKRIKTQLSEIMRRQGGKYKGEAIDGQDSVMFNIYTNVDFTDLSPDRRGISATVTFDAPPGKARADSNKDRVQFWEGLSGKRLMQGGLVALIWQDRNETTIYLGILASSTKDIGEFVRKNSSRVEVRVVFFDASANLRILNMLGKYSSQAQPGVKILVESPVMYEAIRPFLDSLQGEPESIPFKNYLVYHPPDFLRTCDVAPPKYAAMPGFSYQLAPLFNASSGITDLKLFVNDPHSVANARQALKQSRLDPSQATAVVDSLIREVALIQGPPGTGKSFVGVEILRILTQSATPILMIAFTNHALDHLLNSVLDAGITNKIVRLGSRSADERISQFSIENLEMVGSRNSSRLTTFDKSNYRQLKEVEEEIKHLLKEVTRKTVSSHAVMQYLEIHHPGHYHHICEAPPWINALHQESLLILDEGWSRAQHKGKANLDADLEDRSQYAFWAQERDIQFLSTQHIVQTPVPSNPVEDDIKGSSTNRFNALHSEKLEAPSEDDVNIDEDGEDLADLADWQKMGESDMAASTPNPTQEIQPDLGDEHLVEEPPQTIVDALFQSLKHSDGIPPVPNSNRPLDALLDDFDVWAMSGKERLTLGGYWKSCVRLMESERLKGRFESLSKRHAECLQAHNEGKEEIRRQLLKDTHIVGCTTTGAAKLTSLLKGLGPRIMLVEEAGQVLEAHILANLVPSVEHMILIGDPLQLRPTLNNYSLSVESRQGNRLYKFDRSLIERLSLSGFPMSQINVQRRMRPAISNLIRKTLYPDLLDHPIVQQYPDVRGLAKNVFFFDHQNAEGGNEDTTGASKYNTFEVSMIRDLVRYLLRQGCYSQEGDIVVLCAYLGQLAKVRDALKDSVSIVIDERDQQELADKTDEDEAELLPSTRVEHVQISKRVRLRTVDNYQGEEAKIVILSLVRNEGSPNASGSGHHRGSTIGFLKSDNRTNVALSRAKEGLYILGNQSQLTSRSRMWHGVLEQLKTIDAVGTAFPIACSQHPEYQNLVSKPGELASIAPDGGCLRPCNSRLECGHVCPYKCHPDDVNHINVQCDQPCTRLCDRKHPCTRTCSEPCLCTFRIRGVPLPCGHVAPYVLCHQMETLDLIKCNVEVSRALPSCEHSASMKCCQDPATIKCQKPCSIIMDCCGSNCKGKCHDCQSRNSTPQNGGVIERIRHKGHPCQRSLYCAHLCANACSVDHECTTICKLECRQECSHSKCKKACSSPCSPCQELCDWKCPHLQCPVPCGSVCVRLPCDRRCSKSLPCGHPCPSVCGEVCTKQICPQCAPESAKQTVVDLVLQRTLEEIPLDSLDPDDLLITLPKCGHTFTIETLDGVCNMRDWYTFEGDGVSRKWTGLCMPDLNSPDARRPPVCPTCRVAIKSPRYSRVFKSADLEILEKNIISCMTSGLRQIQTALKSVVPPNIIPELEKRVNALKSVNTTIADGKSLSVYLKNLQVSLKPGHLGDKPVSAADLGPTRGGQSNPSNPSSEIVEIWKTATRGIMDVLGRIDKVSGIRSAHIHAWEAAFAYLYAQQLEESLREPHLAPKHPEEHAMRTARLTLGQSQPRADRRFLVDAFRISLQTRFQLASIANALLDCMSRRPDVFKEAEIQVWGTYGSFILQSCKQDAEIACQIAQNSDARRQVTKSKLDIIRANLEEFRFEFEMTRRLRRLGNSRERLLESLAKQQELAHSIIEETSKTHLSVLPDDRREWLATNFTSIATSWVEEFDRIGHSIRMGTFYQNVSLDEKMDILNAFNFAHTGHWYNCPKGHTYVITECGGAMEEARCPECGEVIGGGSHALNTGNSRATDFVNLAQSRGAGRDPWVRAV